MKTCKKLQFLAIVKSILIKIKHSSKFAFKIDFPLENSTENQLVQVPHGGTCFFSKSGFELDP